MLIRNDTMLVIIDVQEKLFKAMYEKEKLLDNLQKLTRGISILDIPVLLTEQNPAGLGTTVPELSSLLTGIKPIPKMSFNCLNEIPFSDRLKEVKRHTVILTGMESHICVYQTAMDLIDKGYNVYVAADCITSRARSNVDISLQEMSRLGARITTAEMALFELLKTASDPSFREISRIVK